MIDVEAVRAEERMRRVRVLLASRYEYLPTPRAHSLASGAGAAQGDTVPCGVCSGRGRVKRGPGPRNPRSQGPPTRVCPMCEGRGWRARISGFDPADLWFDEYLQPVGEAPRKAPPVSGGQLGLPLQASDRYYEQREIDAELAKLAGNELERNGGAVEYGWVRRRRTHDRSGSYGELDRAVNVLRNVYPDLRLHQEAAVRFIAEEMRGPIRVPPDLEADLAAERRPVIVRLVHDEGWAPRDVGRALGLSKEKVGRILKSAA